QEWALADAIAAACAPIVQHFLARHWRGAPREEGGGTAHREQGLGHPPPGGEGGGPPMRLSPAGVARGVPVGGAVARCGVALCLFAHIGQYSAGPAFLRIDGDRVSARAEGTVARVLVAAGDQVRGGQPLVEFHAAAESAAAREVESEYERQLAAFLLDPSDAE